MSGAMLDHPPSGNPKNDIDINTMDNPKSRLEGDKEATKESAKTRVAKNSGLTKQKTRNVDKNVANHNQRPVVPPAQTGKKNLYKEDRPTRQAQSPVMMTVNTQMTPSGTQVNTPLKMGPCIVPL